MHITANKHKRQTYIGVSRAPIRKTLLPHAMDDRNQKGN